MPDQPVMRRRPFFPGNRGHEAFLDLQRRLACGQLQTVRHAEHVRIHGDGRAVKSHGHHDIRGLAPHARQLLQCLEIIGHLAAILLTEDLAGREDMPGLAVVEAAALDELFEAHEAEPHNRLRRVRFLKQLFRHHIDALVRTLR